MSNPEEPAMIWNDRVFSWTQLEDYIHSTSRRLKEIGVKRGSRVLLEAVPSPGMVIVLFSIWHIGAVACPFDPRLPGAMAKIITDKVKPFILLAGMGADPRFPGLRAFPVDDVICLEPVERFISGASAVNDLPEDREATVIFTSGSTGEPKAVLHTLKAHLANAKGSAEVIPFSFRDRWLLSLPLYRVSGIAVLFRAFHGRGTIVLPGRNSPDLAAAILKYSPSHISLVPTQFLRLVETLPVRAWDHFKAILIGGAPVPDALMDKAAALSLPVFLTYGMTETGSQIATGPLKEALEKGVRILKFGEVKEVSGELCVRGDILFSGYLDGERLIRPFDENGWFHTGDAGIYNAPFLKVTGRRDRMFISGGENIFPEVIEKALLGFDEVLAVRVEPKDDPQFGRVPRAYLRLKEGAVFNEQQFKAGLREQLLPFQLPKEYVLDPGFIFPEK